MLHARLVLRAAVSPPSDFDPDRPAVAVKTRDTGARGISSTPRSDPAEKNAGAS